MSRRLIQFVFNAGVLIGLAAISAGGALAFGVGVGIMLFGLVVWISTIVSTALAIAMRPAREDGP
jgi:hypothetical protein